MDQLQDRGGRIQEGQSDRHHHHEKQHGLVGKVLRRFMCEVSWLIVWKDGLPSPVHRQLGSSSGVAW